MKKFFILATAALLFSGATFANKDSKNKNKAKKSNCAKGKSCGKKKDKTASI